MSIEEYNEQEEAISEYFLRIFSKAYELFDRRAFYSAIRDQETLNLSDFEARTLIKNIRKSRESELEYFKELIIRELDDNELKKIADNAPYENKFLYYTASLTAFKNFNSLTPKEKQRDITKKVYQPFYHHLSGCYDNMFIKTSLRNFFGAERITTKNYKKLSGRELKKAIDSKEIFLPILDISDTFY